MKDRLCIKYIQISKFATYNSLEEKIKRIFLNLLPKNLSDSESEFDYKLFKFSEDLKEMLDLILAFVNKNKFFKANAREIKKNEFANKNISDLLLEDDSVLIVEAIPKNMIVKPFIRIRIDTVNCAICNIVIKESKIYCNNCTQSVYCSDTCKSADTVHNQYHQKLSNLFKAKLTLNEISKLKISAFLDANSNAGLTGLKNLDGSSSYLNSALQCLSHCEDLTKYFLSKSFLDDLCNTRQGKDGKIAVAYYEFIKELWLGSNPVISAWDIRNIFMAFMKQVNQIFINLHF